MNYSACKFEKMVKLNIAAIITQTQANCNDSDEEDVSSRNIFDLFD